VQLGEGVEDTRRRARLSEIVTAGETPGEMMAILGRFARPGERLVTFASDRGETTLEVTHEQLIARWPTLRRWLSDWREDERFRRRLAAAAKDWRDSQGSPWGATELERSQNSGSALFPRSRAQPAKPWVLRSEHCDVGFRFIADPNWRTHWNRAAVRGTQPFVEL
jgi:hypothetical protein